MTRSLFDPDGGETERGGSRNLPADADQISQMPPQVTGGEAEEDDAVVDLSPSEVAQLRTPSSQSSNKPADPPANR